MIDLESWRIPLQGKRALVVGDSDWGLEEMAGLLTTLGGLVHEKVKLAKRKVDPGTYIGSGKLQELATQMTALECEVLLVDFDLSPSQIRNIDAVLGKKLILDRSGIILEIFSRHARTKESKLQIELARLQYFMPRLSHLWSHFERQRGSGGGALKGKGMGEKQIEVDRRLVKDRIHILRSRLKEVEKARGLQRKGREELLKVALVGYTNAGKSTLLNALTNSEVLVEDALFATLDASVRLMNPKSRPAVLAIDTVGFIDRLPHGLVASFRSTLAAVLEADLLLHVLDASHPEYQRHFDVTNQVLTELGAEKIPTLLVLNKSDQLKEQALVKIWATGVVREREWDPAVFISAYNKPDVEKLREKVLNYFDRFMEVYEVVIPFEDGKTAAKIYELGRVEVSRPVADGLFFRVKTLPEFAEALNLVRYQTASKH